MSATAGRASALLLAAWALVVAGGAGARLGVDLLAGARGAGGALFGALHVAAAAGLALAAIAFAARPRRASARRAALVASLVVAPIALAELVRALATDLPIIGGLRASPFAGDRGWSGYLLAGQLAGHALALGAPLALGLSVRRPPAETEAAAESEAE